METITLYDGKIGREDVFLYAKIEDGCLFLYGQDFGPEVKQFFGLDEYEYSHSLDEENTKKFLALVKEEEIGKFFKGKYAFEKFRQFCEENGIEYHCWTNA